MSFLSDFRKTDPFAAIWNKTAHYNAPGTVFSEGLLSPAVNDELRLRVGGGLFTDTFASYNYINKSASSSYRLGSESIRIISELDVGSGIDGSITIAGTKNINTDTLISGRTRPDAPVYNITVLTNMTAKLSAVPPAGSIATGDEIVIMNMQGSSTSVANVGVYETLLVASVVSDLVTFQTPKTKYYGSGATDDANIGTSTTQQRVILQRVPNYYNVTVPVGTILTCSTWNGSNGGILFIRVSGTLTLYGTITVAGTGYRGGAAQYQPSLPVRVGQQGEGVSGVGAISSACNIHGGGGGGQYGGGAGGTHKGLGSNGSNGSAASTPFFDSNRLKIYLGAAGGSGGTGSNGYWSGAGSNGGGIVLVYATSLLLAGTVSAAGSAGGAGQLYCGNGGGGAGGTILLGAVNLEVGTSTVTNAGGAAGTGGSYNAGAGGYGATIVYYKNVTGTIAASPTGTLYSGERNIYATSSTIVSTNILLDATVQSINMFRCELLENPPDTQTQMQFSNDGTVWKNSEGVTDGFDSIGTGITDIDISGLSWTSATFYYKVVMTSTGNATPVLDSVALNYLPIGYIPGVQVWTSDIKDAGVNKEVKVEALFCKWVPETTDAIPPRVQIQCSDTGVFGGEEVTLPASNAYFMQGGTYSIDNGIWNNVSSYSTGYYRYARVKVYIDTGNNISDTPRVTQVALTGSFTETPQASLATYNPTDVSKWSSTPANVAAALDALAARVKVLETN